MHLNHHLSLSTFGMQTGNLHSEESARSSAPACWGGCYETWSRPGATFSSPLWASAIRPYLPRKFYSFTCLFFWIFPPFRQISAQILSPERSLPDHLNKNRLLLRHHSDCLASFTFLHMTAWHDGMYFWYYPWECTLHEAKGFVYLSCS